MVKFMIPGHRNCVRINGRFYSGEVVYDNDAIRLPESEIEQFIIKEHGNVKPIESTAVVVKEKVSEQDKVLFFENKNREQQKKDIKAHYTIKQLKLKAKEMGLKVTSTMTEDKLVDMLLDNGFKA